MTTFININNVQKRPTISINNNFEVLSVVANNTYYEAFTMDRLKEKLELDNIKLVKKDVVKINKPLQDYKISEYKPKGVI